MSRYDTMTADEREAERIIRQWIHHKTGVSTAERELQRIGESFRAFETKLREAFAPCLDFLATVDRRPDK